MAGFLSRLLVLAAVLAAAGCMQASKQAKQSPGAPVSNGKGTIVAVLYADSSQIPDEIAAGLSLAGDPPIQEIKKLPAGKFAVGGLQDKVRYQIFVLEKGKLVGKQSLQKEDKEVLILLEKKTDLPGHKVAVDDTSRSGDVGRTTRKKE